MLRQKGYAAICFHVVRLLHEERKRRKLSNYVVAGRSGLSPQMVSYVERGMRNPSLETAVRLAEAIDVDLSQILAKARKLAAAKAK